MHYTFPIITHIDDVLPHIEGCADFIIKDAGAYKVINYVSLSSDTFRPIIGDHSSAASDYTSMVRRECRGIIFDGVTGKVIRRPYHKFFNVNEREESLIANVDLSDRHYVLEKLDGSMIAPFKTSDGQIRIGTKMGETGVAEPAERWINAHSNYGGFIIEMVGYDFTPIFEWCSLINQVVISHPEPRMVLTAVRNNRTGAYLPYSMLNKLAEDYHLDLVKAYDRYDDIVDLIDKTRDLVGEEGYVIRFDDGHMVKIKSDWYVAIHKAKDDILYERNVVKLILDEKIDDVVSFLLDHERKEIEDYQWEFFNFFNTLIDRYANDSWDEIVGDGAESPFTPRKNWAINYSKSYGPFASLIFRKYDVLTTDLTWPQWYTELKTDAVHLIYKYTNSTSHWLSFKKEIGAQFKWRADPTGD